MFLDQNPETMQTETTIRKRVFLILGLLTRGDGHEGRPFFVPPQYFLKLPEQSLCCRRKNAYDKLVSIEKKWEGDTIAKD
jgi:hypothetical protein